MGRFDLIKDELIRVNTKSLSDAEIRIEEILLCPICKGEGRKLYKGLQDRLYHSPGVWGFSHCVLCGSLWLNPRPRREDIHKCYVEYFTHGDFREALHSGKNQSNLKKEKILDVILFGRRRERELYYKMRLLSPKPRGSLLDVGCGEGSYLNFMRSLGWDVMGCEPDPKAAHIAKKRFDLNVIAGHVEDIDIPSNSFDAITLSHVIEHTPDPYKVLCRCFDLLSNGGRLVIITPNLKSLGHRLFGSSWYCLDPPRHLALFSMETLRDVVQDCGFRILISRTSAWYANNIFGASSCIRSSGRVASAAYVQQDALLARLTRIFYVFIEHYGNMIFKDIGEEIGILAVKEEQDNG